MLWPSTSCYSGEWGLGLTVFWSPWAAVRSGHAQFWFHIPQLVSWTSGEVAHLVCCPLLPLCSKSTSSNFICMWMSVLPNTDKLVTSEYKICFTNIITPYVNMWIWGVHKHSIYSICALTFTYLKISLFLLPCIRITWVCLEFSVPWFCLQHWTWHSLPYLVS